MGAKARKAVKSAVAAPAAPARVAPATEAEPVAVVRSTNGSTPPSETCNAKTRSGGRCQHPAGWRTSHLGQGRCHLHGGSTPIKHGRYSTIARESLRALIEQHAADPDPLNIFPELAAARALFQDYVERYDKWADAIIAWHATFSDEYQAELKRAWALHDPENGPFVPPNPQDYCGKPHQVLDVADAYRIVSEITKIVERQERIRAANAISRPDLMRVMQEMGRVVERYVTDQATLENIKDGWLGIHV